MIQKIKYYDWEIEFDQRETQEAHASMAKGGAEQCGCAHCLYWISMRSKIYPPEVRSLLDTLGISLDRETELGSPLELGSNRLLYSGWFHFVGKVISGPKTHYKIGDITPSGNISGGTVEQIRLHELNPQFSIGFNERRDLLPKSFDGHPVVQMEFTCELGWEGKQRDELGA